MAVLNSTTKGIAGVKAAKVAVKNPKLIRAGAQATAPVGKVAVKAGTPLVKRRARRRAKHAGEAVEQVGKTARSLGETLLTYAPQVAYELGVVEPPKAKRTAPRVAAGIVIGAIAMYFLEPQQGAERREKVAQLMS